jgi:hypothetical protein
VNRLNIFKWTTNVKIEKRETVCFQKKKFFKMLRHVGKNNCLHKSCWRIIIVVVRSKSIFERNEDGWSNNNFYLKIIESINQSKILFQSTIKMTLHKKMKAWNRFSILAKYFFVCWNKMLNREKQELWKIEICLDYSVVLSFYHK